MADQIKGMTEEQVRQFLDYVDAQVVARPFLPKG
jgi:cell division septum initiation protein DivIVA